MQTLTVINNTDGLIHVHDAKCRDIRSAKYSMSNGDWTADFDSKSEVADDTFADQIDEGSMTAEQARDDMKFFDCVELPETTDTQEDTVTERTNSELITTAAKNVYALISSYDETDIDEQTKANKFALLHAVSEMNSAVADYAEAQQRMADTPEGYRFDWSQLNNVVHAEVRIVLWSEIVARSSESKDDEDLTVTIDTLRHVARDRAKRLLNDWDRGSSSDSMSNSIDAIKRTVHARFVSYFCGDDMTIKEAI